MTTPPKTTSAGDPPAKLARRTEKQWRHEDRELTGTLALGRLIFAVQGAIIPVTALVMSGSPTQCEKIVFVFIVLLSFASMIGVAATTYLIVRYDRRSARYYAITGSGTEYPDGFDESAEEDKRKKTKAEFDRWRPGIEIGQAVCFVLTVLFFTVIILTH